MFLEIVYIYSRLYSLHFETACIIYLFKILFIPVEIVYSHSGQLKIIFCATDIV